MSRTASRYSVSLMRSPAPKLRFETGDASASPSRGCCAPSGVAPSRACGSVLSLAPNSRSNTARGFVLHRQRRRRRLARRSCRCTRSCSRSSQPPASSAASSASSSDASCVSLPNAPRDDLVHRDARANVRALRPLHVHTGQPRGLGTRGWSPAGFARRRIRQRVAQAGQHEQSVAKRLERVEDRRELEAPLGAAASISGMFIPFGT